MAGDERHDEIDLAGLLAELAGDMEGLEVLETAGVVEYRRNGRTFATLEGKGAADFQLRPDVTRAVLRTPDVSPSRQGDDWVRFAPAVVDRFALDRTEAWFLSAWRLAGER